MARRTSREVPGQLPMLMSARDITSQFAPSDWDRDRRRDPGKASRLETDQEVMQRKGGEAAAGGASSLRNQIVAHGVEMPVHLAHDQFSSESGKPSIAEGHDRIASSSYTQPDALMPVTHHSTIDDYGHYSLDYL
jgi:hypothetical protein